MRPRDPLVLAAVVLAFLAIPAHSQNKITLDSSEVVFSVTTAMNVCGYDKDLDISGPLRSQVRAEVAKAAESSPGAGEAQKEMCAFYHDHQQQDGSRDLAQYISLALNLSAPPDFSLRGKESDLPPDAAYVLGFVPFLQRFCATAHLHKIWQQHQADYEALIQQFHEPVSRMLLSTDTYLRIPPNSYLGRSFTVYLEPMAGPSDVNARNYGTEYYVVVAPNGNTIRTDAVRHTYLHYVLDPLAAKRGTALKRIEPLLKTLQNAPMDNSFKNDISLLLTESLVRAVEVRLSLPGKDKEDAREQAVNTAVSEGFVLTRYFHNQLGQFEKGPTGIRDAYPDWLYFMDVDRETKRAREVTFASKAAPEVVHASKTQAGLLDVAERRLAGGDLNGAKQLAQESLDRKEDPGRALFVLARVATLGRDMAGARQYFEQTLQVAKEPRLLAWSHIYLGRIFDLQENREAALEHYKAALAAGETAPEIRTAAEKGLQAPYEPPTPRP